MKNNAKSILAIIIPASYWLGLLYMFVCGWINDGVYLIIIFISMFLLIRVRNYRSTHEALYNCTMLLFACLTLGYLFI